MNGFLTHWKKKKKHSKSSKSDAVVPPEPFPCYARKAKVNTLFPRLMECIDHPSQTQACGSTHCLGRYYCSGFEKWIRGERGCLFMDQTAETKNPAEDKKPRKRGCRLSGCCERQIERCSLMDLLREETYAFVFRPLTWAGADSSCFTGGWKDTGACFAGWKSQSRKCQI